MTIHEWLESPVALRLGYALLHSLWQGAALCALTAAALYTLRRKSAVARYAVLVGAIAGMILAPVVTCLLFTGDNTPRPVAQAAALRIDAPAVPAGAAAVRGSDGLPPNGPRVNMPPAGSVVAPVMLPSQDASWGPWLAAGLPYAVAAWGVGVIVLSLWHLGGWVALQRLRAVGARRAAGPVERLLADLARRMEVRRPVRIVESLRADVPMVLGVFKPLILMPPAMVLGLSTRQLEAVLAHELAHVRRYDYLVLLLQRVAETLLFYHPGVWWLSRRLQLEQEQCCDDVAAAVVGDRHIYAGALAAIEEIRLAARIAAPMGSSPALAATGRGARELLRRIARLLALEPPQEPSCARVAGASLVIATAVLAAVVLAGAPAARPAPETQPTSISRPAGVVDGVLTVELNAPPSPIDGMLPPELVITARNPTSEPLSWDFLVQSELFAEGKPWPLLEWNFTGPVDRRWKFLSPGEQFTFTRSLPEDLWKDGRPKVLQWRVGDHLSNGVTLTWKPNAELKGKILDALTRTTDSMTVTTYLRGLRLISREALVAGLKDVLSPQRQGFTGEPYKEGLRQSALQMTGNMKLTELIPEVRAIVQRGANDELAKASLLTAMTLPGTAAPRDLAPHMEKGDPILRRYLAGALGATKEDKEKAVAMLHELLDREDARPGTFEEHAFVKIWACQSLGTLGNRTGIPVMIGLLSQDATKDFRGNVTEVLKQITGQSFPEDRQWIDWWKIQAPAAATGSRAEPPKADPAKQVQLVVEAERKEYFVGEPFVLKLGIKNITDHPLKLEFGGDYRGGTRAGRFTVTATDENGVKAIDPDPVQMLFGGLGNNPELAPGDTEWAPVFPLRYCLIDKPGTYTFRVDHDLGLFGSRWTAGPATQPAAYPTAEITLRLKMPDAAQAQKIVDDLVAMKDNGWVMFGNKRPDGDLTRDFATLRLPVYLKPLQKYAAAGKPEVVAGIGSIETPEATQLLIALLKDPTPEIAKEVDWPLSHRLPPAPARGSADFVGEQDPTGRSAALVKATWRPEFSADLRAFALDALKSRKDLTRGSYYDFLANPAQYLERVGAKEDAPVVYDALDDALTRNDRSSGPVYVGPPRNVGPLFLAALALIARGAPAPAPARISGVAVELRRIELNKTYRPDKWQDTLLAGLSDSHPYIRQLALEVFSTLSEPMPDAAKAKLPGLLKDTDSVVTLAAIQAVGKSGDRALALPLLEMLRTSTDRGILQQCNWAMSNLPLRDQWLEICAARLGEPNLWDLFFNTLLSQCLDGLDGGGSSGTVSSQNMNNAQALWIDFVAKHRADLAAGKKVPLDQVDPALAPPPSQFTRTGGGKWPQRP